MNAVAGPLAIRRIIVTLDSSASGLPALQVAVRLAAAIGAELEGVFIEDINLVRLAGLPFLREVRACSLVERTISAEGMQRDLRVLARQAEQTLAQAAAASGVSCSFRVWRGHTGIESLSASFEADILSVGAGMRRTVYRSMPLLSAFHQGGAFAVRTISILFSDSPRGIKALATACHLGKTLNAAIRVLLPAAGTDDLECQAVEVLAAHGRQARFLRLGTDGPAALAAGIGTEADNVLIAEVDHPLLRQAGVARCLERLAGPVLFVR